MQNINVIDGYMVIVFAMGIIKVWANGNKYYMKLDLKGERAFVYQRRLSGVMTPLRAFAWRSRGTGAGS